MSSFSPCYVYCIKCSQCFMCFIDVCAIDTYNKDYLLTYLHAIYPYSPCSEVLVWRGSGHPHHIKTFCSHGGYVKSVKPTWKMTRFYNFDNETKANQHQELEYAKLATRCPNTIAFIITNKPTTTNTNQALVHALLHAQTKNPDSH